ncbi:MAG: hypothetical protein J4215_04725, partial [Candidatus Diapherotrites archaeon]|nr:hypothetical protein [Candidatus Diapherotrites archaeon]
SSLGKPPELVSPLTLPKPQNPIQLKKQTFSTEPETRKPFYAGELFWQWCWIEAIGVGQVCSSV